MIDHVSYVSFKQNRNTIFLLIILYSQIKIKGFYFSITIYISRILVDNLRHLKEEKTCDNRRTKVSLTKF